MSDLQDALESLWDRLLSREPPQIREVYHELSLEEKQAVLAHLQRMAREPGWHREQRLSAQAALSALQDREG